MYSYKNNVVPDKIGIFRKLTAQRLGLGEDFFKDADNKQAWDTEYRNYTNKFKKAPAST